MAGYLYARYQLPCNSTVYPTSVHPTNGELTYPPYGGGAVSIHPPC